MKNRMNIMAALALASVLSACGTTSDIKPSSAPQGGTSPAEKARRPIDLSAYQKVIVLDFVDATDTRKHDPDKARAHSDAMELAVRTFPDLIAQKLRDTGAFQEVVRGPSPGNALLISGSITRLVDGNGALRLLIGFGAGSSYFDATTDISDAETGATLGQIQTDKNSWALGGGLAATQTVQSFMQGAAAKITTQLRDSKIDPSMAKTH